MNSIFRKGSRTYSTSSLFFPQEIQEDVTTLYSVVRIADDHIDREEQDLDAYCAFKQKILLGIDNAWYADDEIIDRFTELSFRRSFHREWIVAFFDAMESDITHTGYSTRAEVDRYIYGSAEVIGLMMARILQLKPELDESARMLGRSMQYINFIRDIHEDTLLGRCYFPREELARYDLENLSYPHALENRGGFITFIHAQLEHYHATRRAAQNGIRAIPKRLRIPIATADSMYAWTAQRIREDPLIIYRQKVRPSKRRIILEGMRQLLK